MSEETDVIRVDIDADRHGFAGMHDVLDGENINRTLKQNEVLKRFRTIYLDRPPGYVPGAHKMLLVQGPHDEREGTALFPLGLGYIARVLHDIGVAVEVLDAHAERHSPQDTLAALKKKEFDLVGITALSTQYGFVKWIADEIRAYRPSAKIIVGGQLAHYNPRTVIENSAVDVCVIGEGEITIQDIIYNLDDLSGVAGIAYRDQNGQYRRNQDRPRISNVEAIPFPYWNVFKLDHYFTTGFYGSRARRAINVLSSRGCPYSCTFCSLSFPNVTYRAVDNVIEEIKTLKENYGVDGIMFADELFIIDKKRVYEFCEKIKPIGVSWGGQGRANIVNDDERLLRTMKESGAAYVGFGLESATSEILTKMQKKATVQQNINCIKTARKVGLHVVAQYMFGFPGETLETIKAGVDFFKEVNYCPPVGLNAPCHISLTTPLPGSQLYEDSKKSGIIADEDEYLTRISRGYFYNEEVIVNLTQFSDEELIDLKHTAQQTMVQNYIEGLKKEDPFFSFKRRFRTVYDVYRYEGAWALILKVAGRLLSKCKQLLLGDLRALKSWGEGPSFRRTDYVYRSSKALDFKEYLRR